jgi:glycosyltransferase involved in cell wall biosynthesis
VTRVFVSPKGKTNPYQVLLADALRDHGVDVEHVDIGPFMPVKAIARRGIPDVVHFHWLNGLLLGRNRVFTILAAVIVFPQLLLLRALGVRVVWTAHNITEHDPRYPTLERALKHLFVRCTDAVIVHCSAVADVVLDAYRLPSRFSDRFHTVPHGHYCGVYENTVSRQRARDALGLTTEFTFLFFGRIAGYKNVPGLVDAFLELDRADTRLLIAGNPTTDAVRSRVQRAAEDDRVDATLEFIPDDRVQYYMNAADVVVLPFQEILTSGSTMLAMSFGKPVVVPDAGCISALVPDDGGFTYQGDESDSIRRAMERAMRGDLGPIGSANRAAVERLTWERIAARTHDVYAVE